MQEYVAALAAAAPALQVGGERPADVDGQRQPVAPAALADHDQLPGTPIDVLERQRRDLAGAQSQPHQQRQDRVVAAADRRARSQPANSRVTSPADSVRDSSARRVATAGTAAANGNGVYPRRYKNRSSARRPVIVLPSDPTPRHADCSSMNALTSTAVRHPS